MPDATIIETGWRRNHRAFYGASGNVNRPSQLPDAQGCCKDGGNPDVACRREDRVENQRREQVCREELDDVDDRADGRPRSLLGWVSEISNSASA